MNYGLCVKYAGLAEEVMALPHTESMLSVMEHYNTIGTTSVLPDLVHEASMHREFASALPPERIER